jgi:hypothetical protein
LETSYVPSVFIYKASFDFVVYNSPRFFCPKFQVVAAIVFKKDDSNIFFRKRVQAYILVQIKVFDEFSDRHV